MASCNPGPRGMIKKKLVLLFKSQRSDGTSNAYENILTSKGFEVRNVESNIIHFRTDTDILKELSNSSSYQGIIFSSPRSVEALNKALADDEDIIKLWQEKNNFAVGTTTYKEALDKLGLKCVGHESGNYKNLSKTLEKKSLNDKPFLWPRGNKSNRLKIELEKATVKITDLVVYDDLENPDISKELMEVTDNFMPIPEYVVFFSPSGFHSAIVHLEKLAVNLHDVKFIAFGPSTESAIKAKNYQVYGVLKNPTPQDLLNLLLQD